MNYIFNKPWKKNLIFGLFSTTLISLLLSIYFWNTVGYVNVIRFLIYFIIFILSSLVLCIFCLLNALKFLKSNEEIRKESLVKAKEHKEDDKKKVIDDSLIEKITNNLYKENKEIDYDKKTIIELRSLAKRKHLKGYSKLNKKDLIKLIKKNKNIK